MTGCELDLVTNLKNKISSDVSEVQVINEEAKSIASQTGLAIDFVESRLTELMNQNTQSDKTEPTKDIKEFFKVNGKYNVRAYSAVKRNIKNWVIQELLNGDSLIRTDDDINDMLYVLQRKASRALFIGRNKVSELAFYINMTKNSDSYNKALSETESMTNYLVAAHLPSVVNSWLSDLLYYDPATQKYSLNIKSNIRRDWTDNIDDKEAEMNSYLETMCKSTPLYRFNSDGSVNEEVSNMKLTKNAFFAAMNYELKNMPEEDYEKYIRDPYTLIDYLVRKYQNSGANHVLEESIMHSFVYTWIHDEFEYSMLYENSIKAASNSDGFNPLDIIIKNANKFILNNYVEYDLSDGDSTLSITLNENSKIYKRMIDHVDYSIKDMGKAVFKKAINVDSNNKYSISDTVSVEDIQNLARYLFENSLIVTDGNKDAYVEAIEAVLAYKNSNTQQSFAEYIGSHDRQRRAIYDILNIANSYNIYAISGAVNNKMDKALPTVGLSTISAAFEENVYKNRMRLQDVANRYTNATNIASRNGIAIINPTSPFEHTHLFNHRKSDRNRLYLGTSYRSTLTKTINNEKVTKDCKSLSIPEAFQLAIYHDFLDPWNKQGQDEIVRIQPITPSDKSKIPFFEFSTWNLKKIFGRTNREIEKNVIQEFRNIYGQYLLNTVNDFIQVFNIPLNTISNITDTNYETLIDTVNAVNKYLADNKIDQTTLNSKVFEFNNRYELNKNIAEHLDYVNGEYIQISPYSINTVNQMFSENPFDALYLMFLKDIPSDVVDTSKLYDENGLKSNAKEHELYTYFLMKNVLSEEILVNLVGTPLAHKGKGSDYLKQDSNSHITMVKRMVALTATMHACNPTALGGLGREVNMMTVRNDVAKMFTYSGNTQSGNGFESELEASDGSMFSLRFVDNLLKQSMADSKPKGIDLKLLLHYQDPEKGSSYLSKLASYGIDNALLRMYGDPNVEKVGGINPLSYMELATRTASFRADSFNEDGHLVDYNGDELYFDIFVNRNGAVHEIVDVRFENGYLYATDIDPNGNETEIGPIENNLFAFWQNILGGQYSSDSDGVYGEQSQDTLSYIINNVGQKLNDNVRSTDDVDQYLKKQIVHYFCTSSAQKSLQAPIVDVRQAIKDPSLAWTIKMGTENFGLQQDSDHSAEDGQIREITQLISFITEHGYVPETVDAVYRNLGELVKILGNKTFIDIEHISDPKVRTEAKERLDRIFGPRIQRVLTSSDNALSVATEIMNDLKELGTQIDLKAPYSDNGVIGKLHTTVGSYLNKFISRNWNGRADVMVPSHNMFMIYEDDDGTRFLYNDSKYNSDGSAVPVAIYLHNKVWMTDAQGNEVMRPEYVATHKAQPYEVMPVDTYYRIDPNTGEPSIIVIDTWDKLNTAAQEITSGIDYIKAIDLPRNLRSKRCFVDVNGARVGLYYFKTLQEISKIGNSLDTDLVYNGIAWTKNQLLQEKQRLQTYWEDVVLKAIADKRLDVIFSEMPEWVNTEGVTDVTYVTYNSEKVTTNNYSNKFGIRNMNFSEIQQKKESYFKEKLLDKFKDVGMHYDVLLYTSDGTPTMVYVNGDSPDLKLFTKALPVVDEDGYRVDRNGNQMYKWPENARLMTYRYGNRSIDVIITNDMSFIDDNFSLYRSNRNLDRQGFYNLNGNEDLIFDTLAKSQYNSWLKSNTSVSARIPSQSLAFAMNMDTVAYLPYGNNISFVPNEMVYLEGSDYDIDKIYSIMAAIGSNGVYKGFGSGTFTIENDFDFENMSDQELDVHKLIARLVVDSMESPADTSEVAQYIYNFTDNTNIRISKSLILNALLSNLDQANPDDLRSINIITKDKRRVNKVLNEVLKKLQLELFALNGLRMTHKDDVDAMQNFILEGIKSVYDSPNTLLAANNPTTMEPINGVVEDMNLEASLRNHLNPATTIYLNQSTSVGKIDIGIAAVAQKAFYALTYYNELKYANNESLLNITTIDLPSDWRLGNSSIFSLGFAGSRLNQKTLDELKVWAAQQKQVHDEGNITVFNTGDVYCLIETDDIGREFVYIGQLLPGIFENAVKENNVARLKKELKLLQVGSNLCNFVCTTINSSWISSATDNAKEMKLDLLNASPEILPAYEYLLSIGVSVAQGAKILTDPIIPKLVTLSRGNLFKDNEAQGRMSTIFNMGVEKLAKELYGNTLESSELKRIINKLKIYKRLFKGAQELTTIGQALGINGGFNVDIGSPLIYQLNLERNIMKLAGTQEQFSLERYFNDPAYAQYWIQNLEKNKQSYNLLDLMESIPHYRAMFEVPIQYKNIMQLLSKDIDNTYSAIYNNMKFKYRIDDKMIRQVLKVFNDRKVFEFFRNMPFIYKTSVALQQKVSEGRKLLTQYEETLYNDPITLSTDTIEGMVTLKRHIERNVFGQMFREYSDNEFVRNLIYNTNMNYLFSERVGSYGSRVNLGDPQYEDMIAMIKDDFYKIQNNRILDHSIMEWMFIYDLLTYKHAIDRNSFSAVFDGAVDLSDENNIITKWVKFVNDFDNITMTIPNLSELSSIPNLESLHDDSEYYAEPESSLYIERQNPRPRWAVDPNYMPLFVRMGEFEKQTLMNLNILSRAFSKGIITATLC